MEKILFISTEGSYKKGVEKELSEILSSIKNEYNSNVDDWWNSAYLDEEMDLLEDGGAYDEELNYFIEINGEFHDIHEFLASKL
tara:strand:+ start:166 stop:417 length:252 start_codon:yes stop_codon:yes gene_type:complete